jgi:hypothetical protein
VVLAEEGEQGRESALLKNVVAALGRIAGNVAERPDGLLADVEHGRREESNEVRDRAGLKDDLGV